MSEAKLGGPLEPVLPVIAPARDERYLLGNDFDNLFDGITVAAELSWAASAAISMAIQKESAEDTPRLHNNTTYETTGGVRVLRSSSTETTVLRSAPVIFDRLSVNGMDILNGAPHFDIRITQKRAIQNYGRKMPPQYKLLETGIACHSWLSEEVTELTYNTSSQSAALIFTNSRGTLVYNLGTNSPQAEGVGTLRDLKAERPDILNNLVKTLGIVQEIVQGPMLSTNEHSASEISATFDRLTDPYRPKQPSVFSKILNKLIKK